MLRRPLLEQARLLGAQGSHALGFVLEGKPDEVLGELVRVQSWNASSRASASCPSCLAYIRLFQEPGMANADDDLDDRERCRAHPRSFG